MTASDQPPKKKKLSGTPLRFASAIPLVLVILWLLFYGPVWGFQAFTLLAIAIASRELIAMTTPESKFVQVIGMLISVAFASLIFFANHIPHAMTAGCIGLAICALVVSLIAPEPIDNGARRALALLGTPIYVGATLATAALLHGKADGAKWMVVTMMMAFFSDTGAYFAGRAFGKRKLSPKLSPKKTIEGAIGGLIAATIGVACMAHFAIESFPVEHAIALGVIGAALGQAGDLLESLLKRSCGVKDSGNIMPGHGGLLDRVDALIFTGSVTWLYVEFLLPR